MMRKALLLLLFFTQVMAHAVAVPSVDSIHIATSKNFSGPAETTLVDPVTGITIGINVAKFIFGFFATNNTGPQIEDYLKNLSDQLSVVNLKMDLILNQLESLRNEVMLIPVAAVSELRKNELKGCLDRYHAVLTTVVVKYGSNIKKYVAANKDDLVKLADEIRRVKRQLATINDPSLVPFVSIAINMDYSLRLNFLGLNLKDNFGELNEDQKWLKLQLFTSQNSLQNTLTRLKQQRITLVKDTSQYIIAAINPPDGLPRLYLCPIAKIYSVDTTFKVDSAISILYRLGILDAMDLFTQAVYKDPTAPIINARFARNLEQNHITFETLDEAGVLTKLSNDRSTQISDLNKNLRLNYLSRVAIASSYYGGIRSLDYCNSLLQTSRVSK